MGLRGQGGSGVWNWELENTAGSGAEESVKASEPADRGQCEQLSLECERWQGLSLGVNGGTTSREQTERSEK